MGRLAPFWVGPVLTGLICVAASAQSGSDVDRTRRSAEVPSLPQEAPPSSPPVPVLPPLPPPPIKEPERLPLERVFVPVMRERRWADVVQVAPFVDVGWAWNTRVPTPEPTILASVGLGLRWAVTFTSPFLIRPQFEVYWGLPLNRVDTPGGNLQDYGLHLQLVVTVF